MVCFKRAQASCCWEIVWGLCCYLCVCVCLSEFLAPWQAKQEDIHQNQLLWGNFVCFSHLSNVPSPASKQLQIFDIITLYRPKKSWWPSSFSVNAMVASIQRLVPSPGKGYVNVCTWAKSVWNSTSKPSKHILGNGSKIGCKRTIHFKIFVTNYYSRHLIGVDDFEPWPSQQGHLGKHWGQQQSLERHRVGPPAVPSKAQIKLKTSCRLVPPVRNRETKWQMDHTTMTHLRGSKMNCLCQFIGCC